MTRLLKSLLPAILILLSAWMVPAGAKAQTLGIAAVVNEGVITVLDLQTRIELALLNSGLPATNEQRQRLAGAVLRELIDEEIQRQEIEAAGIEIGDSRVAATIAETESNNGLPPGGLARTLAQRSIPIETVQEQIRTQIGWFSLVGRRYRRLAQVSAEEIDEVYNNLLETADQEQERISEILLPVDDPGREQDVLRFANRLVEQIRQGASFEGLANQFSSSPTSQAGGALGWVSRDAMNEDQLAIVPSLQPGEVSDPVRTLSGYMVLRLEERGSPFAARALPTSLDISQVFLPVRSDDPEKTAEVQREKLASVTAEADSCLAMEKFAAELESPVAANLGKMALTDLQPDIRNAVLELSVEEPSDVIELPAGLMVAMVCEREGGGLNLPSKSDIEERLQTQKLNVFARRMLRDAKRAAFIDVRL